MDQALFLGLFAFGMIAIIFLTGILIIFGRLIWLQMRIWLLAKKGFTQIRHIREDKAEKYYYIRLKDGKYEFDKGIYIAQRDTTTRPASLLNKMDYELLSKKPEKERSAEEIQLYQFLDGIRNSKVMDITTLSWGIPTISYFGNNPNPVNYSDIKKLYDAKNISALIKRILLTKEWKLVRMVLILCAIALFLWVVLGFITVQDALYGWTGDLTLVALGILAFFIIALILLGLDFRFAILAVSVLIIPMYESGWIPAWIYAFSWIIVISFGGFILWNMLRERV